MAIAPAANAAVEMMTLAEVRAGNGSGRQSRKPSSTPGDANSLRSSLRRCFWEPGHARARLDSTRSAAERSGRAHERGRRAKRAAKPGDRRSSNFDQVLINRLRHFFFSTHLRFSSQPRLLSGPSLTPPPSLPKTGRAPHRHPRLGCHLRHVLLLPRDGRLGPLWPLERAFS